jgi:outer membrane protein assembly factor BamB
MKSKTPLPLSFATKLILIPAVLLTIFASDTRAADWPQFLGPFRNGVYPGDDLAGSWQKEGPATVWKRKVGQGFSGPVVLARKAILFHRIENQEVVECIDALTGKTAWQFKHPASYRDDFGFDEGPRATPTIDSGNVFVFGADGLLHCIEMRDGRMVWSVDVKRVLGSKKGFFGFACSPLVDGGRVFLNPGGADGAGIVAFEQSSGKLLWKATAHEGSYSSPVATTLNGHSQILFFTRDGLVAAAPESGRIAFEFPWRSRTFASVNAATPLVVGQQIFLSASYETGGILLQPSEGKAVPLWASDDSLSSHYATGVYKDGFLYGFHGRQDVGRPSLRCVDWKTGVVKWSEDSFGAGTVTLAGDKLLVLHEDGRLIVLAASPVGFKPIQEAQILPSGVRAYPAIADGFLFARSRDQMVCIDLRKRKSN